MTRRTLLALVLLGLLAVPAPACNVPVFRYALERWAPDPFEVFVFHRGPLTAEQQRLVGQLEKAATDSERPANLKLTPVDLADDPPESLRKLYSEDETAPLPGLVVYYPKVARIPWPVWSGPLSADNVGRLVDSPARRELLRRILKGDTAIWVLLEGTDAEANDSTEKFLGEELKRLAAAMKLPVLTDDPADTLRREDVPFQLAFSVLRLKRDDSAEALVAAMLVQSEDDLADRKEAMVFPVYGRGRVLNGLIGLGINAENIREAVVALIAACSCDLKALHPGFELLMAADWQGSAPPSEEGKLVPIPRAAPPAPESPAAEETPRTNWGLRVALIGGAGLMVALTGVWLLIDRLGRPTAP